MVGDLGGKLPFISNDARENSIQRYMAELREKLNPVFNRVQDKIMQDIKLNILGH